MTPEEIEEAQCQFEEDTHNLQYSHFEVPDDFFKAVKAVTNRYAEKYPDWAAWAEEVRKTAVG